MHVEHQDQRPQGHDYYHHEVKQAGFACQLHDITHEYHGDLHAHRQMPDRRCDTCSGGFPPVQYSGPPVSRQGGVKQVGQAGPFRCPSGSNQRVVVEDLYGFQVCQFLQGMGADGLVVGIKVIVVHGAWFEWLVINRM